MHYRSIISRRYFRRHSVYASERWYHHIARVLRIMLHKRVRSVACGRMQPESASRQHKFYDRAAEPRKLLGPRWAKLDSRKRTELQHFDEHLFFDTEYLSSILIRYWHQFSFRMFKFNENLEHLTRINSLCCNVKIFRVFQN